MSTESTIPRRCDTLRNTPAELAIRAATDAVEAMGADPLLTDAVSLLEKAREKVADYVDWQADFEYVMRPPTTPLTPLNIDPDWLREMAGKEGNGGFSVGGLVTRVKEAEAAKSSLADMQTVLAALCELPDSVDVGPINSAILRLRSALGVADPRRVRPTVREAIVAAMRT